MVFIMNGEDEIQSEPKDWAHILLSHLKAYIHKQRYIMLFVVMFFVFFRSSSVTIPKPGMLHDIGYIS